MRKYLFVIGCLFFVYPAFAQDTIHLEGSGLPTLTAFAPKGQNKIKRAAVIICPGGAYARRSDYGEGVLPAERLNKDGIVAFLLDYRLPKGNDTIPLHDARTALHYIREHCKEYNIDPKQVGIMGFSAGGHLASTMGTHFQKLENRPDFMVLAYPVISMADSLTHIWSRSELLGNNITPETIRYYSNELQVSDSTPGTFLVHGMRDEGVTFYNSLYFYAALLQHKVPCQIFIYPDQGHAFPLYIANKQVQWIDQCIEWIKKGEWRKNKKIK